MSTATTSSHALPQRKEQARRVLPAWFAPMLKIDVLLLALTGFGQMPIYSRYYVTSIPGLGWTGEFYLTHVLHYFLAAVFLGLLGYAATCYLAGLRSRFALSGMGWLRVALYGGIVLTGVVRVLKNMPQFFFDPTTVMLADWLHLGFVMLLGVVALAALIGGRKPYLVARN